MIGCRAADLRRFGVVGSLLAALARLLVMSVVFRAIEIHTVRKWGMQR